MNCSGESCRQGRERCKTPAACFIAEEDPPLYTPEDLELWPELLILLVLVVPFLLWCAFEAWPAASFAAGL